jgi:hypothetical protein
MSEKYEKVHGCESASYPIAHGADARGELMSRDHRIVTLPYMMRGGRFEQSRYDRWEEP